MHRLCRFGSIAAGGLLGWVVYKTTGFSSTADWQWWAIMSLAWGMGLLALIAQEEAE